MYKVWWKVKYQQVKALGHCLSQDCKVNQLGFRASLSKVEIYFLLLSGVVLIRKIKSIVSKEGTVTSDYHR